MVIDSNPNVLARCRTLGDHHDLEAGVFVLGMAAFFVLLALWLPCPVIHGFPMGHNDIVPVSRFFSVRSQPRIIILNGSQGRRLSGIMLEQSFSR
jgi:hypothetical protein